MRTSRAIDALLPKTRQAILAATLMHPDRWWYLSELAKHLGVRPSSLQRELATLVDAGILQQRCDGNRVYFCPNADCPFLSDLQGLLTKTVGLADVLREALEPFASHIDWAFVYGSIARAEELASSDVDLMIIGRVGLADMAPALRWAETRLNRPVNPTVYSQEEFAAQSTSGDPFLQAVLDGAKLGILGSVHDLATTANG
jgi:hypothetical protein